MLNVESGRQRDVGHTQCPCDHPAAPRLFFTATSVLSSSRDRFRTIVASKALI